MSPTRLIACAITQHRPQDTSQSIGKVAQGLAMPLPLGPQCFVHAGTLGVSLHRYPRQVGEGMAQASVTAAPPHHLAALPPRRLTGALPPGVRHTGESRSAKDCAAAAKSPAVLVRPTPGRDGTMATSEGADAALASANVLRNGLTCGSQARVARPTRADTAAQSHHGPGPLRRPQGPRATRDLEASAHVVGLEATETRRLRRWRTWSSPGGWRAGVSVRVPTRPTATPHRQPSPAAASGDTTEAVGHAADGR